MSNKHFTAIVVGDNPDKLLEKYSPKTIEPYVVFEYDKMGEYHQSYIKLYSELLENKEISDDERDLIAGGLQFFKDIDDHEFFIYLSDGYEIDPETSNIISNENPNKKFDGCNIGSQLSMPLTDINGYEKFQCRKKDIDWNKVHLGNSETYKRVWEMVMEGDKPKNEIEEQMYENMKNRKNYFNFFQDKDTYVIHNTAFWGFAFLSEATGWIEIGDDQIKWVKEFYDKFIKDLSEDSLISVYECTRLE